MKKLFALLLAMVLVFSLAACGSGSSKDVDDDKQNIEENNDKAPAGDKNDKDDEDEDKDSDDYIGIWYNESDWEVMEFTKKGTCILTSLVTDDEYVYPYSVDGDVITINMSGEDFDMEFEIDGDTAVFNILGEDIEYVRVDSIDDIEIDDDFDYDFDDDDFDYDFDEDDLEDLFGDVEVDGEIDEALIGKWIVAEDGEEGYFEFNDDNTCTLEEGGESVDAQWYVDGDELFVVIYGIELPMEYEVKGKKLTLTSDGETITFEKE